MTVQELYDWAKRNNCLNVTLAKYSNMEFVDVESATRLSDELPVMYKGSNDRVVID